MNKKSIIISLIVLTIVLIIGSSYAYLKAERESEEQSLSMKNFGVILLKDMVSVTLDKTVPMSDEDGIYNESTTFEIQNTGNVSANYKVSLVDKETKSTMSNNDIRYRLTRISSIDNTKETFEIRNLDSNGIIDEGVIEVSEIITYEIVLWIDIDANPLGQTFNKVVEVDAFQNNSLDRSGANPPEMLASMIPVYYEKQTDESGIWKIADITNRNKHYAWYNYADYKKSDAEDVKTMVATILPSGDISLDGTDDYVNLGYENYDFKNNISVVARFKVNSFPSNFFGYIIGNAEGAGFYFGVLNNKKIRVGIHVNGGYKDLTSTMTINGNTWYTVVATYDNNKIKLYIYQNGSLLEENEMSVTGAIKPSIAPLMLGGNPGVDGKPYGEFLNYIISDTLVYTDTLTDTEIKNYFTNEIIDYPKDNLLVEKIGFLESESNRWANVITLKEGERKLVDETFTSIPDTKYYEILDNGDIYLDGVNDFYNLGHANEELGSNISLVARFKLNSLNNETRIISNTQGGGCMIRILSTKKIGFSIHINGAYRDLMSTNLIEVGKWYTVVATYDNSKMKLYVYQEGKQIETKEQEQTGAITKSAAPFTLGSEPDAFGFPVDITSINGTISKAIIYKDTLTLEEITNNFTNEITNYPEDNILIDVGKGKYIEQKNYYTINDQGEITFNGQDNFLNLGYENYDFKNNVSLVTKFKIFSLNKSNNSLIGNAEGGGISLYVNNNNIRFEVHTGGSYHYLASDMTINENKWYTAVGTYDGSKMKLYIYQDGKQLEVKEQAQTGAITKSPAPLMLGGNPNAYGFPTDSFLNGSISSTYVYNDTLTDMEIESIGNDIKQYPKNNLLIAYEDFKEKSEREILLKSEPGTEIKTENIANVWVWIPRFKYNSLNESVNFSNGIKKEETTLQAFTNENKELVGFYVSKEDINNLEEVKQNIIDNNKNYEVHTINDNEKAAANYLLNSKYGNKSQLGNTLTNNRAVIDIYHEFPWLNE